MYDSAFSTGALILTRLPSITPTTPGNPPCARKLSIVSLNCVSNMCRKLDYVLPEKEIVMNGKCEMFLIGKNPTIWPFDVLVS